VAGFEIALLPGQAYEVRYTPQVPVLGFAFESQSGVHAFACDRVVPFRTRPNSIACTPPGCEVFSRSTDGGEYLTVTTPMGALLAGSWSRFNDRIDTEAIAAAESIRSHLLTAEPCDMLELEGETLTLCDAVSRAGGRFQRAPAWMTTRRMRLVDELIDERLSGTLGVTELAANLGLSAGFFTRAFKAATGKTPHQYVIDRRIARARRLIMETEVGLAEIALATGFASQAHMTTLFRRRLRLTPSLLRGRGSRSFG
jgi:AraC family transcriptional regulator